MRAQEVKVYINHDDYGYTLGIYVFKNLPDGRREYVESLRHPQRVKVYGEGPIEKPLKPTIFIEGEFGKQFLQALADELYAKGIKPHAKPVLENELESTKYHLEDMRKIQEDQSKMIEKLLWLPLKKSPAISPGCGPTERE